MGDTDGLQAGGKNVYVSARVSGRNIIAVITAVITLSVWVAMISATELSQNDRLDVVEKQSRETHRLVLEIHQAVIKP